MTGIRPLRSEDHDRWLVLWGGYLSFYESTLDESVTESTFRRLVAGDGMHGAVASDESGEIVGIVHWLFHTSTWSTADVCYLNDLFVAPEARGAGIGRALIEHVVGDARGAGAHDVYWLTQVGNATARRLYDTVATDTGFVHYEVKLS